MSRKQKRRARNLMLSLTLLLATASLIHCGPGTPEGVGTATIQVNTQALTADDIASLKLTITGPGIAAPISQSLTRSGNAWTGTVKDIPEGQDRSFVAEAYDQANTALFRGEAKGVEIFKQAVAMVMIRLQQLKKPKVFKNRPPEIQSLFASPMQVKPGESVELEANATDPNPGDTITYGWTSSGGTFAGPDAAHMTWNAPSQAGSYKITVTVSDSRGLSIVVSTTIEVVDEALGSATIEATTNTWPQISNMFVEPARIDLGEKTLLTPLATDLDGDTLQYQWSDSGGECAGQFSNSNERNPIWTAPAQQITATSCALTLVVKDGKGGSSTGTVHVQIGPKHSFKEAKDTTPPTTTSNVPNNDMLYGPGQVTLTCTDSGSGCAEIIYTTDGSEPSFENNNGTIVQGSTATPEVYVYTYFATVVLKFAARDKAGNIEPTQTFSFMSL